MVRRFVPYLLTAAVVLSVAGTASAERPMSRELRSSAGTPRTTTSATVSRSPSTSSSIDRPLSATAQWKDRSPKSTASPSSNARGAQRPTHDGGTGIPQSRRQVTSVTKDPKTGAVTTTSWAKVNGVDHSLTERANPGGRVYTYVTAYHSTGAVTSHTTHTPARTVNGKSVPAQSETQKL